jgi:hypothetical protein
MLISLIVAASALLLVHITCLTCGITWPYSLLHRITHTAIRRKLGIPPDAEIPEDPYPDE